MSKLKRIYMVFDVESIGLHGEGFAVAFVVVDGLGSELDAQCYACPPGFAVGPPGGRDWVEKNCPDLAVTHQTPHGIRTAFWKKWMEWRTKGVLTLVSDCGWPVECNFLTRCVAMNLEEREWQGPYPLHDLASILLAKGKNPLEKRERVANELPEHHPLADARQSARILIETLNLRAP